LCALPVLGLAEDASAERTWWPVATVMPVNDFDYPRIIGVPSEGDGPPMSTIDVYVENYYSGYPIPDMYVTVEFDASCTGLCFCDDAQLSGVTDDTGHVLIDIKVGGCCEGTGVVRIIGNGVLLAQYDMFVSPDFDQMYGSCDVLLPDFITFGSAFGGSGAGCSDFTGDGQTDISDFIAFGSAWGRECAGSTGAR